MPASCFSAMCPAQPSSGAQASPVARSMFQLCSGQVTVRPETMPCDSGPPLCGHLSCSANSWSSAVRKMAMSSLPSRLSTRAPCCGMSASWQTAFQLLMAKPFLDFSATESTEEHGRETPTPSHFPSAGSVVSVAKTLFDFTPSAARTRAAPRPCRSARPTGPARKTAQSAAVHTARCGQPRPATRAA